MDGKRIWPTAVTIKQTIDIEILIANIANMYQKIVDTSGFNKEVEVEDPEPDPDPESNTSPIVIFFLVLAGISVLFLSIVGFLVFIMLAFIFSQL